MNIFSTFLYGFLFLFFLVDSYFYMLLYMSGIGFARPFFLYTMFIFLNIVEVYIFLLGIIFFLHISRSCSFGRVGESLLWMKEKRELMNLKQEIQFQVILSLEVFFFLIWISILAFLFCLCNLVVVVVIMMICASYFCGSDCMNHGIFFLYLFYSLWDFFLLLFL